MLSNGDPARTTMLSKLDNVNLLAGGKGRDTETGKSIIPEELAVSSCLAAECVDRSF